MERGNPFGNCNHENRINRSENVIKDIAAKKNFFFTKEHSKKTQKRDKLSEENNFFPSFPLIQKLIQLIQASLIIHEMNSHKLMNCIKQSILFPKLNF